MKNLLQLQTENKRTLKTALFGLFLLFITNLNAQVYNVEYSEVNFGGAGVTITNKIGNGEDVGDIVLYENVVTVEGQQVDAIIRTESITGGSCSIFDYTGTSQNNEQRWFSPQFFYYSSGGSALFKIEFIMGGSYDDGTNTGTAVTLQNIIVNTYDIDGNGNKGSNQTCDFGGFETAELGDPTNLEYSYDHITGLTRFRSTLNTNTPDANDERNRVRCTYSNVSIFNVRLGGEGFGAAYYFLDFSAGDTFETSDSIQVPELDLDTYTEGVNHDTTFNGSPVNFTTGATNISYSGSSIDSLKIYFNTSMILDGGNEKLLINGMGGTNIPLNFIDGQSIPDFVHGGNTYQVLARVNGKSSLIFSLKNGGSILLADAEAFIDSISYHDSDIEPTISNRLFDVTVQDREFESGIAQFDVTFDAALPVELMFFQAMVCYENVELNWETASERNNSYFSIERTNGEGLWDEIGTVPGIGTSTSGKQYFFNDNDPYRGISYYRLRQFDFDGKYSVSETRTVINNPGNLKLISETGTNEVILFLPECWEGYILLNDAQGNNLFSVFVPEESERTVMIPVNSSGLNRFWLKCVGANESKVFSFIK